MDLEPITGAPKAGGFVIVFDETRGEYDVARWSKQDAAWVNEGGEQEANQGHKTKDPLPPASAHT